MEISPGLLTWVFQNIKKLMVTRPSYTNIQKHLATKGLMREYM
jgi:hypothetical protein